MNKSNTIIIGSRKSLLAMQQAVTVSGQLKKLFPEHKFVIKKIITSGDRLKKWPEQQAKGLFVKEIEEALLNKEIDLAVHSMKDLPVDMPKGLKISAITKRVEARDVLISNSGHKLKQLAKKSIIGTSSPRRKAQLLLYRPDFKIVDIRGNLDTRLKKLRSRQFDAIVIAAAGIIRLGWQNQVTEYISENIILPAPGQGVLGIQTRTKDKKIEKIVRHLDHNPSRLIAEAERGFLKDMGGGCRVPIGAVAKIRGGILTLKGIVAYSSQKAVKARVKTNAENARIAGRKLAQEIKSILKKAEGDIK
jgi:hydroxymethylbilane synthase